MGREGERGEWILVLSLRAVNTNVSKEAQQEEKNHTELPTEEARPEKKKKKGNTKKTTKIFFDVFRQYLIVGELNSPLSKRVETSGDGWRAFNYGIVRGRTRFFFSTSCFQTIS